MSLKRKKIKSEKLWRKSKLTVHLETYKINCKVLETTIYNTKRLFSIISVLKTDLVIRKKPVVNVLLGKPK